MSSLGYIDSHIHLDQYENIAIQQMMDHRAADQLEALIAVSMNPESCARTEQLAQRYGGIVYPAYGYHPEQPLPSSKQTSELLRWIEDRIDQTIAIGEIGLPYYLRQDMTMRGDTIDEAGYIQLLDQYLQLASRYNKPVILHAVYEDADTVCQMLQRHHIQHAHFHWFKGAASTVKLMAERGYYISFTPDILYESEIRELAALYPPELVMIETDGPWPFEGPYTGQETLPAMVADVCRAWAEIQGMSEQEAAQLLYANTCTFYQLSAN